MAVKILPFSFSQSPRAKKPQTFIRTWRGLESSVNMNEAQFSHPNSPRTNHRAIRENSRQVCCFFSGIIFRHSDVSSIGKPTKVDVVRCFWFSLIGLQSLQMDIASQTRNGLYQRRNIWDIATQN